MATTDYRPPSLREEARYSRSTEDEKAMDAEKGHGVHAHGAFRGHFFIRVW
jgi:hypothetical protein